jgi:hypothetical protein
VPSAIWKTTSMAMAMPAWNSAEPNATTGRTSSGKTTFFTRLGCEVTMIGARPTTSENRLKVVSPAKRMSANSRTLVSPPVPQRARNTTAKTKVNTASRSSGVRNDQSTPRTEPR